MCRIHLAFSALVNVRWSKNLTKISPNLLVHKRDNLQCFERSIAKKNWHLKEDTNNQLLHSENAMKNNHNELLHLTVNKRNNRMILFFQFSTSLKVQSSLNNPWRCTWNQGCLLARKPPLITVSVFLRKRELQLNRVAIFGLESWTLKDSWR